MNAPLVSVILPVFNGQTYLTQAIESIFAQSYKNLELIVIDDGSTDQTKNILTSFDDKRLFIIEHKENKGLVYSLNEGLAVAKGKYIARMDSDDVSLPLRIEKQVLFLENEPEYGLVGTNYAIISPTGQIQRVIANLTEDSELQFVLTYKCPFAHGSVMMRSTVLGQMKNPYDTEKELVEDYDLWVRLSQLTKIKNLQEVLYFWRNTQINISSEYAAVIKKKSHAIASTIKNIGTQRVIKNYSYYKKRRIFYEDLLIEIDSKQYSLQFTREYQRLLWELAIMSFKQKNLLLSLLLIIFAVSIKPSSFLEFSKLSFKR